MSFDTDFDALLSACYEIQPDTQFIYADQNGVEATPPYCLITTLSEEVLGKAEEGLINDNGEAHFVENIRSIIRFTFHGTVNSEAYNQAKNFKTQIKTFIGRAILYQHGFSFLNDKILRRSSDPRDTTMYVNNIYEVTLMYRKYSTYDQFTIDEVIVTGDPSDTQTLDVIIDIK